MAKKTRKFKAEVTQILSLVINSLYSNKEIFLRELISNSSDALDKLQFEALTNGKILGEDTELKIRITADEEAGTVTIWDNGIGMTEEELIKNLGTVAHSGSKSFMEALEENKGDKDGLNIIGQFGVGFYSAYLVADQVEVISRKAGTDEAFKWTSDAKESFSVAPAERDTRGTSIVLHLKDEQKEYASPMRLRNLVSHYSDFVSFPIEMLEVQYGESETPPEFEQVNQASALWQRPAADVTEEQYAEFYTHLTHDWEKPVTHTHFKVEGTQLFTGLLYIPKKPQFDLYQPDAGHGVRLFVRRVFIMDNADALVPRWLRFVRGVVDSDDLPLNVSREILQDSRIVTTMRKQVTKKSLDMLQELADERPEDYLEVWNAYGPVIKEGLHFEPARKDKLSKLLRFETSAQSGLTSLDQYLERMPEGQEAIYYALGQTKELLHGSPHLEVLKKKGFEVLYLTDSVDQWAIENVQEYGEVKLVDAIKGELSFDDDEEFAEAREVQAEALAPLTERFQELLQDQISEVRVSTRLEESPACLVVPEGGVASHIERMLREQNQDMPAQKRVLEINPNHPLIEALQKINATDDNSKVQTWVELIYDQALIAEGSPIEHPALFAQRLTGLMQEVAQAQL